MEPPEPTAWVECSPDTAKTEIESLWYDCTSLIDAAFCYGDRITLDEVRTLSRCEDGGLAGPKTCEELMSSLDCDPSLAMSETSRAVHRADVEEALEDLSQRCPTFASFPWFLDCERMPCVLGIPREALLETGLHNTHELACNDPMITTVGMYTQYNATTLVPLVALPGDRSGVDLEARWRGALPIRWKELSTWTGFFPGQDEPPEGSHRIE